MNAVESYFRELLSKLELHGAANCPVCNMRNYEGIIYSRPIETDEVLEEYDLMELSCKGCGNVRTFNMRFFHGEGGVLEESKL